MRSGRDGGVTYQCGIGVVEVFFPSCTSESFILFISRVRFHGRVSNEFGQTAVPIILRIQSHVMKNSPFEISSRYREIRSKVVFQSSAELFSLRV